VGEEMDCMTAVLFASNIFAVWHMMNAVLSCLHLNYLDLMCST